MRPFGYCRATKEPLDIPAKEALRRVTWTLRRADQAVLAAKEPGLRAVGIPQAHYNLLIHVYTYPGLAGAELARRIGVSSQAVASLAAKLEASGLLERRPHSRHHHVKELHLTTSGRQVLREAEAVITELEARVCEFLGPDRSEQLRDLLEEVIEQLTRPRPPEAGTATD